jgi:hypothetical protein
MVLAEIRLQREERLRRQAEAKWLEKAAKAARGFVSEEAIASVMVTAAETITGKQLPQLRPPIEVMLSPTQIAAELGVSAQKVGRLITKLGLRGKDGFSQAIMNTKPGTDKQVVTYLYTRDAVERITNALNA